MLPEGVTQQDLRRARSLQDALDELISELTVRVAEGAYVETGALALLGPRVVWSEVKTRADRFRLFSRLLDKDNVQFFEFHAGLAKKFRRARAQIFLAEVRALRVEIARIFRARRDFIVDSGKWTVYLHLVQQTASAYAALSVLSFNGRLFYWNMPFRAGFALSGSVLYRYLSFESPALGSQG
jgi:hypothetical protein